MSKKVLIIDDELSVQKAISDELTENGLKAIIASDGMEGLEKVKSEKPDLILLDIIMPKLDGVSVLKELQKDSDTSNIPVIILTNLSDKEAFKISMESGGTDYLVKSDYTLEQVLIRVREKLEN